MELSLFRRIPAYVFLSIFALACGSAQVDDTAATTDAGSEESPDGAAGGDVGPLGSIDLPLATGDGAATR